MKKIDIPIKNNNIDMDSLVISGNNDLIVNGQTINPILLNIKNKSENNILLSKEELIYLYNLYNQNKFNYYEECLIEIIISNRDLYQDLAYIFDCSVDEITDKPGEVAKKPDKYVVLLNDFELDFYEINNKKFRLKYISGYLDGSIEDEKADIFSSLEIVGSYVELENNRNYLNLKNLKYVGGEYYIDNLMDSNSLTNLEYIGGNAYFNDLKKATGLKNLSIVIGSVGFCKIKDSNGLNNLKYIGRDADFQSLKDASGLENLMYIGNDADFRLLDDSTGLNNLQIIGGCANFYELIDASSLCNLRYIGNSVNFQNLKDASGLEKLLYIGTNAWFNCLRDASGLKNLRIIKDEAHFENLENTAGLENLQYYREILLSNEVRHDIKRKARIKW